MIRKGKAGKPTEFGKLVKLQETDNQIIVDYEVYAQRPSDTELLIPALEAQEAKLGRVPRLLAADAGFYSSKNETAAKAKGVKRVCIPNRSTKRLTAGASRRSDGFAPASVGVRDAKVASVSANVVTASIGAINRS